MKRICIIITALALVLGFAQCKKSNDTAPDTEGVRISLVVDDGSKADVNPGNGTVTFKNGDVIYVGSGGKYVGSLTRTSGVFTGDITNPVEGEPLYFCFLGNLTPTIKYNVLTVSIIDQTTSLPVISCGTSTVNYSPSVSSYSAVLMNKCALVKFNVTTSSSSATCILGFNNKMAIDFSKNTFSPSQEGNGVIRLASGNGEKWAVLLPQDAIGAGSAYSYDGGSYIGTHNAIPAIAENDYLTSGIDVTVSTSNSSYVDLGLPSGTLWATYNIGAHVPEEYGNYYAWGETQTKSEYYWSTYKYCVGDGDNPTKYCCNPDVGYNGFTDNLTVLLPSDDAATANWGSNWRMATREEWDELLNRTSRTWTTLNGVNGLSLTASNGNSIFLPAAGSYDDKPQMVGQYCGYWSSTQTTDSQWSMYNGCAYVLNGYSYNASMGCAGYRCGGVSVRAVLSSPLNNTPTGAINGKFTINANGDKVCFSQGNLQYIGSATPYWKFADNQWEYLGTTTGQNSSQQNVDRDLFGWGTSGYNHGAVCYQPWSTSFYEEDYNIYGGSVGAYNLYDHSGQAEWGYNAILNGGNIENSGWRTPTDSEWYYLFMTRNTESGARFAKGCVNGVNGAILLPDEWNESYYSINNMNNGTVGYSSNIISASQWSILEQHGAVFLPAAGARNKTSVLNCNSIGYYWTSTANGWHPDLMFFSGERLDPNDDDENEYNTGCSVRLVKNL